MSPATGAAKRGRFGPGFLVAAAFIGPGTVTTATLAGAGYGTALLWAVLISVIATMVLQEMAARLGLVTRLGLGEAIRVRFTIPIIRTGAVALVVLAIGFGNAAYQTGNLLGGSLGLSEMWGGSVRLWVLAMAGVAFLLLWRGSYRVLEVTMALMVGVMSLTFVATAAMVLPDWEILLSGLFTPTLPPGSILLVAALVGTTVVPYNLFLHASAVSEKWSDPTDLHRVRGDLVMAIGLGGMVTMAVLLTSAGTIYTQGGAVTNAADMAVQLEPLLGGSAKMLFSIGLFAAGMTSAVTAPLAAAYAVGGCMGWRRDLCSRKSRMVWGGVLGAGVLVAMTGVAPLKAILIAQAANGILLPVIACFLLVVVNDPRWLREKTNNAFANVLGVAVVLVAAGLGMRLLYSVLSNL